MSEEDKTAPKPKPEAAVLRDSSLSILAREIAPEKVNAICFLMYLNIPTSRIISLLCDLEQAYSDSTDQAKIDVLQMGLFRWKATKAGCKEREKVREMEKALRELGKAEMADVFMDRHANATELTSDAFSNLG